MAKSLPFFEFPYTLDPADIPAGTQMNWDCCADTPHVKYGCPSELWRAHLKAWSRISRENPGAPQPMPEGHCMFESPADYAMVPYSERENTELIRAAWRLHYAATLDGWDSELKKTPEGLEQLERIIATSVNAKMAGREVGASRTWRASRAR